MKTKEEIVANWLPRYTKRSLNDFGEYILLTNWRSEKPFAGFAEPERANVFAYAVSFECGIAIRNFNYAPVENMAVDQDAIAFRLYVTPSETQPSIRTEYGNEATKVQNLYVYCQFLTRFDPDAGPSAQ